MRLEKIATKHIILSLLGFILLWTLLTDAWGYSSLLFSSLSNDWGSYLYGYISRIIWAIPALWLIFRYHNILSLKPQQLFSKPQINRSLSIVIGLCVLYCLIGMFSVHRGFWFNSEINLLGVVVKIIIVGVVEELVFRGWGYNALRQVVSEKKAVILSTFVFMLLHWPAYFIKLGLNGHFEWSNFLSQSFIAIIWGLIFCYLFKKGKNLWNPIIVHIFYDLLVLFIVG